MGNHRASIKIEFEMHGIVEKADMWINWSPDFGESRGCDRRIIEFFEMASNKAMNKYDEELFESQAEERKRVQEEKDRKELERLKAKYESA